MKEDLSIVVASRQEVCGVSPCPLRQAASALNNDTPFDDAEAVCTEVGLVKGSDSDNPIFDYAIKNSMISRFDCNADAENGDNQPCGSVVLFKRRSFPGK